MVNTSADSPDETELALLPVSELTARLSSSAPVPGGGSAAAIAGSMGAALVAMVANLTVGRAEYAEAEPLAEEIGREAMLLRDQLTELAQRDSEAYGAVVRARRLPKESDDERARRKAAMGEAFVQAATVPMETARTARQVLALAARIAPIGNRNAASDAGVAAQLASAAVRGAILNVRINLPYLPADAEIASSGPTELERLGAEAVATEREALAAVEARLG
jgi:formiminotetrahydrofolate cyclodeaminase